jgi:hypothetical protein
LPLSEKSRIEVYLPDIPDRRYQDLLELFESEFAYAFGGCTIIPGLHGSYLSKAGSIIKDRVNLLYSDTPFILGEKHGSLDSYARGLRRLAFDALHEEAILVVVNVVHHST